MTQIDKRLRANAFRDRLARAMARREMTQSELARRIGVDRSTISQLLTDGGARLPNAHVVGACAQALGVSADWLLMLSDRPETTAEILSTSLSLAEAPRALIDDRIYAWHVEASGYKIRHVPATMPDMLKTRAMLEWEYAPHLGRTAEEAIAATEARLALLRQTRSDYEIALPLYEVENFANATGYYRGLPSDIRAAQIDHMLTLAETLYPRLRLYLFDAQRLFSAPITIFGPLLSVVYIGSHYMVFRDRDRIDTFTRHFDQLVREADLTARDIPAYLRDLRAGLG